MSFAYGTYEIEIVVANQIGFGTHRDRQGRVRCAVLIFADGGALQIICASDSRERMLRRIRGLRSIVPEKAYHDLVRRTNQFFDPPITSH